MDEWISTALVQYLMCEQPRGLHNPSATSCCHDGREQMTRSQTDSLSLFDSTPPTTTPRSVIAQPCRVSLITIHDTVIAITCSRRQIVAQQLNSNLGLENYWRRVSWVIKGNKLALGCSHGKCKWLWECGKILFQLLQSSQCESHWWAHDVAQRRTTILLPQSTNKYSTSDISDRRLFEVHRNATWIQR